MLELVVVLTIVALATLAMAAAMPRISPVSAVHGGASELAGMLRQARMRAISRERTTMLSLDSSSRRCWIPGTGKAVVLPEGVAIAWRSAVRRLDVRFFPDGSADGVALVVSDGDRRITLTVSPLTGYVRVL